MSGMMAAIAGSAKRLNLAAGLYLSGSGPDTSPIGSTAGYPTVSEVLNWTGYYQAPSTGTFTFGTNTTFTQGQFSIGTQYSQGRIWIGSTAISGYNDSNLLAYSNSSYGTGTYPMTQGLYYPIRLQWSYYDQYGNYTFYAGSGTFDFYVNNTTSVGNTIFYNLATNSF